MASSMLEVLMDRFRGKREELPVPEQPDAFLPDIPVMGRPALARLMWEIAQDEPGLKKLIGSVSGAPNRALMDLFHDNDLPVTAFDRTSLMGLWRKPYPYEDRQGSIFVNPSLGVFEPKPGPGELPSMITTLFHEIEHARGGSEMEARLTESKLDPELHRRLAQRVMFRRRLNSSAPQK